MPLYKATVDEFCSLSIHDDGETVERRRYVLVEADDVHAAARQAEAVGEANAMMGGRLLAINVIRVSRINLPAEITYEYSERTHMEKP